MFLRASTAILVGLGLLSACESVIEAPSAPTAIQAGASLPDRPVMEPAGSVVFDENAAATIERDYEAYDEEEIVVYEVDEAEAIIDLVDPSEPADPTLDEAERVYDEESDQVDRD